MRLSVAREMPRVIAALKILTATWLFRLARADIASLFSDLGIQLAVRDERADGETLEVEFRAS